MKSSASSTADLAPRTTTGAVTLKPKTKRWLMREARRLNRDPQDIIREAVTMFHAELMAAKIIPTKGGAR